MIKSVEISNVKAGDTNAVTEKVTIAHTGLSLPGATSSSSPLQPRWRPPQRPPPDHRQIAHHQIEQGASHGRRDRCRIRLHSHLRRHQQALLLSEISGLKFEVDVIETKSNTSDGIYEINKLPGKPKPGEVVLTRAMRKDEDDFATWFKLATWASSARQARVAPSW